MWLALGTLAGHFTITSSHVQSFGQINLLATVLSLGIATGISCYCVIRHRAAKLSVLTPSYRAQNWLDVKFRLFIDTLAEQFRFFLVPVFKGIDWGDMPKCALRDVVVVSLPVVVQG